MSELKAKEYKCFENIKRLRADGSEYWLARELASVLGYAEWEDFMEVINKAMIACKTSDFKPNDHFADVRKTIDVGDGATRQVVEFALTRFACYLIIQNSDPHKEAVALVQTYFASQTHRHEVRSAIKRVGGTMPEELPTPDKSIAQIEKERIKELKRRAKIKPLMLDE